MILVPVLVVIALPSFGTGTLAEKPVPESLGQAVRDMSYIVGQESNYDFLNGIFHVGIPLLLVLPVFAVYHELKKSTNKRQATATTVLGGLSIATSVALAPFGYLLPGYSDSYALATSEAQRASLVSSGGFAITLMGVGEVVSAFLLFGWIFSVSLMLLSSRRFRPWISYLGMVGSMMGPLVGGLLILGTIVAQSWSAFFFTYILWSPFFFLTFVWFIILGYKQLAWRVPSGSSTSSAR